MRASFRNFLSRQTETQNSLLRQNNALFDFTTRKWHRKQAIIFYSINSQCLLTDPIAHQIKTEISLSQRKARRPWTRRVQFRRYTLVPLLSREKDIRLAVFGPERETSFPCLIHPISVNTFPKHFIFFYFPPKRTRRTTAYRLRWSEKRFSPVVRTWLAAAVQIQRDIH